MAPKNLKGDRDTMVKIKNVFGDEYSGTVAKTGVYSKWKGIQYRRKHVIPHNPKTAKQTTVRGSFANAVSHWKTAFNGLQKVAYKYLAGGKAESGFNMFVQRWQTNKDTTRTVDPSYGLKTIGSALTLENDIAVGAVAEAALTLPANNIVSIDNAVPTATVPGGVTDGSTPTGAKAWIDLYAGQVRQVSAPVNAYYLTYKVGGNQVIGEPLTFVGGVAKVKHFPVDYGTCELVDKAAAPVAVHDAASVLAGEVDIVNGKVHTTYTAAATTFAAASKVKYTTVAYLANTKVTVKKANSSFVAFRGYTDSKGGIGLGLTAQDETYDVEFSATGYALISRTNQPAVAAAANESVILTAS